MKPLIVQSDKTILLDVHAPESEEARSDISGFVELIKSPEHIHTYRITPLSLWNAASFGIDAEAAVDRLGRWSRYELPDNIVFFIRDIINRFGKVVLLPLEDNTHFLLHIDDPLIKQEIGSSNRILHYVSEHEEGFTAELVHRGTIKQELMKIGYPAEDKLPLLPGERLSFTLREVTSTGAPFSIRPYQREAADMFVGDMRPGTGFGTVILPCGAGKTIVGMAVMTELETNTLILTTNVAAVHQWIEELKDKSSLPPEDIGEYTGEKKEIRPITIATYQILTWRPHREAPFPHFDIFRMRNWGLVIYDEVHLLPAPVFRVTAEIQAIRRLGLTATLVREDNREEDVFSLVGPKRYDVPWKELESKGWIAEANCYEIRIQLPEEVKIAYASQDRRRKYRIASENPYKLDIARMLLENHTEDSVLLIGHYLDQLKQFSRELGAPLITGKTPNAEREALYSEFKQGKIKVLVVSKVANFAIDLPDASVAIQVSGTFGSRQEEAQRLGRILRPKKKNSYFYTIVSQYTVEEEFAGNRQKFLTEQGYKYHIEQWYREELEHIYEQRN